jgi:succinate dehydrogenase/fumarate reductase cytochrome b subunit
MASLVLILAVPAFGLYTSVRLGRIEQPTIAEVRARGFAHLAYACPPLFTLIGVLLYVNSASIPDLAVWAAIWLAAGAAILVPASRDEAAPRRQTSAGVRFAHGASAAAILAIFLVMHIGNHLVGLWGFEAHKAVMTVLRHWYRSPVVEPALILLMVFQVLSGAWLLRARLAQRAGFFETLQSATGAYLGVFIVSHVTAVLVLGRSFVGIDTDFYWASGEAARLIGDPWNVRLIPHYLLAVWGLIAHAGCGLRTVMLAHRVRETTADKAAAWISACGALVAIAIVSAQSGLRLG